MSMKTKRKFNINIDNHSPLGMKCSPCHDGSYIIDVDHTQHRIIFFKLRALFHQYYSCFVTFLKIDHNFHKYYCYFKNVKAIEASVN